MAGHAKGAVIYVIADQKRLAKQLAQAREHATDLRRRADEATSNPNEAEELRQRAAFHDAEAAYLNQQHAASVTIVEELKVGLRRLFEKLSRPEGPEAHPAQVQERHQRNDPRSGA